MELRKLARRAGLAAMGLALVLGGAAQAQQAQIWNCEEGVRDLTGNLPTVLWRYQMALNADGTFFDSGIIFAVGLQYQMQAQGHWQAQGGTFQKSGIRQDTMQGQEPYQLTLSIGQPGAMHDTTQSGNTVFAAQCQRVQ